MTVGTEPVSALAVGHELKNRAEASTGSCHCLIVSSRPAYRQSLAETASQWGWETLVCATAEEAHRCLDRLFPQLAFVDLVGSEDQALKAVAEHAAGERRVLLVVCGHEEKLDEELWARQLGAWFYLPGPRESATIGLLCRDARTIVQTAQVAAQKAQQAAQRAQRGFASGERHNSCSKGMGAE
jgi:DNA-binding NtrC family response regulator